MLLSLDRVVDVLLLFKGQDLATIGHGNFLDHAAILSKILTFWVVQFQWWWTSRSLHSTLQVLEENFVLGNRVKWTAWPHLLLETITHWVGWISPLLIKYSDLVGLGYRGDNLLLIIAVLFRESFLSMLCMLWPRAPIISLLHHQLLLMRMMMPVWSNLIVEYGCFTPGDLSGTSWHHACIPWCRWCIDVFGIGCLLLVGLKVLEDKLLLLVFLVILVLLRLSLIFLLSQEQNRLWQYLLIS
jgi:hypothetical protein